MKETGQLTNLSMAGFILLFSLTDYISMHGLQSDKMTGFKHSLILIFYENFSYGITN